MLIIQAALLGVGAVGIPGLLLFRFADESDGARATPGGETVISKLDEAAPTPAVPAGPLFKGLGEIPWEREAESKPTPKPTVRVFAQTINATNALPWDATEPVPFTPRVARDTVIRKTSVPETKQAAPLPIIDLPPSGDVEGWVKAKAKTLKGENRGRPIYHFELWLDAPAAIKQRLVAVAYDFNTPAVMPQSQISSEEKTGFRVAVGGLACADKITITLQFDDGRSQQVAVDGCRLLG